MQSAVIHTPVGNILISGDEKNITQINFTMADISNTENLLIQECIMQLSEYFEGKRKTFDLPLKQEGTDFQQSVWNELLNIPAGVTISYGDLSKRLGKPGTERAVGAANGRNNIAIIIPCHRVIGNDGSLTGYAGGIQYKQWLLNHESKYWKSVHQQQLFG